MLSIIQSWLPKQPRIRTRTSDTQAYCYHGLVHTRQYSRLERNLHLVSGFREQVRFFRRQGVMSLDELTNTWGPRGDSKRRAVVITFDDGYANNLLAAEILAAAKLPWAIFVSTNAMGRDGAI